MNRINVVLMIGSMDGGGSERQTLLLLRHLNRDLFNIHLYVKRAEGSLMSHVPDDVQVHTAADFASQNSVYWPGRIASQEAKQFQQILTDNNIDVVYDRTYHMSLIAAPACLALARAGQLVPRISTIVSPPSFAVPSVESRFIELKRRRLADAYGHSAHVIAVSQIAANDAADYYDLPPDQLTVIRNPVDVDAVRESSHQSTPAFQQDLNRLNLVCVGRMTSEKGHAVLLSALHRLQADWPDAIPPIHVWLVGDGVLRDDLANTARQLGLTRDTVAEGLNPSHCVSFLGHVDEPAASIAAADALVLPSLFEGLPNVVLESMAVSTPVIATRAGGTTEIQHENAIAFWADPGDAESLADALLEFATNRNQAEKHVQQATRVLAEHHNVTRMTHQIESMLQQHGSRPESC